MKVPTLSKSEARNPSKLRLERYPLPKTTESICSQIREVLIGGNVVHLEMSVDDTLIRVLRQVSSEELEEDAVTWDSALQSVENMDEYSSEDASPFQILIDIVQLVSDARLHPIRWIVGSNGQARINKWLEFKIRGLPEVRGALLGIPLMESKNLPAETLVLCASPWASAGPEEISFAVKTVVELKDYGKKMSGGKRGKSVGSGGGSSTQFSATAGGVALTSRSLRRVAWKADSEPEEGVDDN